MKFEIQANFQQEDGVGTAIQAVYRDLEYAKTLARQRSIASSTPFSPKPSPKNDDDPEAGDDLDDIEEWTFVGDDTDVDITKGVRGRAISDVDIMLPERLNGTT